MLKYTNTSCTNQYDKIKFEIERKDIFLCYKKYHIK